MSIKVLIVDDEPFARGKIVNFLKGNEKFSIAGESGNGKEALEHIKALKPDLVFLDIQMPELDGFEVVKNLDPAEIPYIVFVTAYDNYAIDAFEVNALDYLLKPFERERFSRTLNRAIETIEAANKSEFDSKISSLIGKIKHAEDYTDKVMINTGDKIQFIEVDRIIFIKAAGNYVIIFDGKNEYLMRETLNNFLSGLDPKKFLRCHRSTIVNTAYIKEIIPLSSKKYTLTLKNGSELSLSRKYFEDIKKLHKFSKTGKPANH
ncbi:LytR/AlgR family response regulator transcription factor [candidate division KSB1 bacterium]